MKMTPEKLLEEMQENRLPFDDDELKHMKRMAKALCPLINDRRGLAEALRQEVPEIALRLGLLRRH